MQNVQLDTYIKELIAVVYGDSMDESTKQTAHGELKKAFQQLFNARLLQSFSDEQLQQAVKLAEADQHDEILQMAHDSDIDMKQLITQVIQEFEAVYAPRVEE